MRHAMALTPVLALGLVACVSHDVREDTGPVTLPASDVHIVGTSQAIGAVQDLEVLPDTSVWVFNSVSPFFIGFDTQGHVIGQYGTRGGGPQEFRMPAGLLTGGFDGEAWALDFARHEFIRVSEPDSAWAELPLPRADIPPGGVRGGMNVMNNTVRTARLGRELIVPWTPATPRSGVEAYRMALLGAKLAAFDPRTDVVRTLVDLGTTLDDPTAGFEATDGGFPLWYRLWAVCGDELRVYDRTRNQLRGFTGSGEEIAPVDLPPVQLTEVTPMEFARAVFPLRQAEVTGAVGKRLTAEDSVRVVHELASRLKGSPQQLAAYLPRYVDFRCSSDKTTWLQPIDLSIGALEGGRRWLRIEADGTVRAFDLPERFDAMRFAPDRIWGVQRDELDVASVAWISLPGGKR